MNEREREKYKEKEKPTLVFFSDIENSLFASSFVIYLLPLYKHGSFLRKLFIFRAAGEEQGGQMNGTRASGTRKRERYVLHTRMGRIMKL